MAVDEEMRGRSRLAVAPEGQDRGDVLGLRRDEPLARSEAVVEVQRRAPMGAVGGEVRRLRRARIQQRQHAVDAAVAVARELFQSADGVEGDGGGCHDGGA